MRPITTIHNEPAQRGLTASECATKSEPAVRARVPRDHSITQLTRSPSAANKQERAVCTWCWRPMLTLSLCYALFSSRRRPERAGGRKSIILVGALTNLRATWRLHNAKIIGVLSRQRVSEWGADREWASEPSDAIVALTPPTVNHSALHFYCWN